MCESSCIIEDLLLEADELDYLPVISQTNNSFTPRLLTRSQISQILNVSESNAKRILAEHGVQPIDLGRGRGNGLRWHTEAVIKVADILHTEAQSRKPQRRKQSQLYSIKGKTAAQLLAEFNRGNPSDAEVCNGN